MTPGPDFCPLKQRLIAAFTSAVSDYNLLQAAQIDALLKGQGFAHEEDLAWARDRRDRAKYAILAHQDTHGC